jgi:Cd2+/Zn2+-exporting ATPase
MTVQEMKLATPIPATPDLSALTEPMRMTRLGTEETGESWWKRWRLVAAAVGCWTCLALAFTLDHATSAPHSVVLSLYVAAYLAGGTFATIVAVQDLLVGQVNVDLLMVTAAIGAAFVGAWAEGAVLLGLFSTSNALEHFALGRTQHAVKALMDLSPDVATVLRPNAPGGEVIVGVDELTLTDIVLVRPGERIAVDGTVIVGESTVDQSAITGESMPVKKLIGASVFAGTINGNGALQVRVTKLAHESTLSRIIAIVEEARQQKSQTQRFTDAFEGKYAIGVIVASALVAILPPLVGDTSFHDSFYRAMTLLVVASPCALVISTPASTLSALANAARHGILFKGSNHLENAGTVQTVAFDKTGTLTEGRPRVTAVVALNGTTEQELLRLTASAERLSEHHIAEAVLLAASEQGLTLNDPTDFQAIPGKGVVARIDGCEVIIGNEMLLAELGVNADAAATTAVEQLRAGGNSAIFIANRDRVRGIIAVADTIRPAAAAAVRDLKGLGIQRTVMLTGDNKRVADAIGAQVGVDEVQADLLPEEKLDTIRELMKHGPVAMIGDGVNDAPALATATIGIAMGAAGTDVALETADVVLMADDLSKLPYAISLSRRTRRTIIQNLAFSLSVIAVLVTAALTIGIPLPLGVVGHEGSTIIVVTNGLRLLRTRE